MRYILFLLILLCSSFSFAQENDESVDSDNIEEVVTQLLKKLHYKKRGWPLLLLLATDIESKNLKEFYDFSVQCAWGSIPKNELFRNWCFE